MKIDLATTWWLELHQALIESFNLEAFELLCSDLKIIPEELDGDTLAEKVVNLIDYIEEEDRLVELVNACESLHSRASWNDIRHLLPRPTHIVPLAERFSLKIKPEILTKASYCEVTIHNEGIQRTSYTITGSDPFGLLQVADGQEWQKVVSPGCKGRLNIRVMPKKRPWLGLPRRHTFTIHARTTLQNQQTVEGQIIIKPILPVWVNRFISRLKGLMPA